MARAYVHMLAYIPAQHLRSALVLVREKKSLLFVAKIWSRDKVYQNLCLFQHSQAFSFNSPIKSQNYIATGEVEGASYSEY